MQATDGQVTQTLKVTLTTATKISVDDTFQSIRHDPACIQTPYVAQCIRNGYTIVDEEVYNKALADVLLAIVPQP